MPRQSVSVPVSVIAFGVLLSAGSLVIGGNLNPPAGPVTPTMKPLDLVEPRIPVGVSATPGDADSVYKITQPGSYYLTGNITGQVGKHGVEIAASGVTLDLNGFDLVGVPGMGTFDGVSITVGGLTNIAVVNGSVRDWGDEGVDLRSAICTNLSVINVRASGNAGDGIRVGVSGTVTGCTASFNGGDGFSANVGSTISGCTARENTGDGFSTNAGCTISECSAYENAGRGFTMDSGCTISGCTAYNNGDTGIITSFPGCTISDCTANSNGGNGVQTGIGSKVSGCTTRSNALDGIRVSSDCVVVGNTSSSNGSSGDGAGIHASGNDNRIEGNNCTDSTRGIDVDSTGNFIAGNTCSGNTTNWDVVAGNVCLVVSATTSAAVLGNSGGVSPGSTNPNANFTY